MLNRFCFNPADGEFDGETRAVSGGQGPQPCKLTETIDGGDGAINHSAQYCTNDSRYNPLQKKEKEKKTYSKHTQGTHLNLS